MIAAHSEAWMRGYKSAMRGYTMSMIGVVKQEDWPDFKTGYAIGARDLRAFELMNGTIEGLPQ